MLVIRTAAPDGATAVTGPMNRYPGAGTMS